MNSAPAVGGGVLAPARDGEVAPAAGAAAGVGRHDVVAAVRQQVHFGQLGAGLGEHAHDRAGVRAGRPRRRSLRPRADAGWRLSSVPVPAAAVRSPCQRVGHEAALHRLVEQHVRIRQQAHALVMRHELRARWRAACRAAPARACSRSPHRSHSAEKALVGQRLQVAAGLARHHHQRQRAGVGRDHQIVAQPALEAEARHAEGAVLVDLVASVAL
jgi:hypothetical protein